MMSIKIRFFYLFAALILIVIGTILGILAILYFYSSPAIYIILHPIFQILGLSYFVIGVAIVLLPYFKSKKFEQISFASVLFIILVFSFTFAILSIFFQNAILIFRASITLLSLILFFYFLRFSLIKTNFPEADPFFHHICFLSFIIRFTNMVIRQSYILGSTILVVLLTRFYRFINICS